MKILTWNINGIRSVKKEKSLKCLFDFLDADIICLQETKITRDMLDEETAIVEGYNSYFSFSKVRSGYSGVATFCREHVTPVHAEDKICLSENYAEMAGDEKDDHLTNEEVDALNAEGRTVLTEHLDSEGNHVVIINIYCPRADLDNKERTHFKLQFYSLVQEKCKSLLKENKHVIVLGDFNVSHKLIDHCDPDDPEIFNSNPSRQWASTFILDPNKHELANGGSKFVDSFRYFHPNQQSAFTCWSTVTGARQTNYGTRIDYIFSSVNLFKELFSDSVIRPDIEGSDHCPVIATLKASFRNSGKPPLLCTKYMPEFSGKQQKLKAFFLKKGIQADSTMKEVQKVSNVEKSTGEKRPGSSLHTNLPKRLKTTGGSSQGNLLQFFSKTNTKGKMSDQSVEKQSTDLHKTQTCIQENTCRTENSSDKYILGTHDNDTENTSETSESPHLNSQESQLSPSSSQDSTSSQNSLNKNSAAVIAQWKNLLKGPPPAPLCTGHSERCVLRTVKNKGPNHGKQFYCCARPQGHSTNKEARCNYFKWVKI